MSKMFYVLSITCIAMALALLIKNEIDWATLYFALAAFNIGAAVYHK